MDQQNYNVKRDSDEAEDVEKLLSVVVKRRKTLPAKCMELNRRIAAVELHRLENSIIELEKDDTKENFKEIMQGVRNSKPFMIDDLEAAEKKILKYFKKVNEINEYLRKTRRPDADNVKVPCGTLEMDNPLS